MSIYSANQVNWKRMEVFQEHLRTPIKSAQGGSPCSRSDCPSCTGPATNSHVRDLTYDLEVTPVKLTTPPNHWIINITKAFKEAIQNQDTDELEIVKDLYQRHLDAVTIEDLVYDRTEIKQLNSDAMKFLANFSKPTAPPNHWIAFLVECFKEAIQEQDTAELECLMDLYSNLKKEEKSRIMSTDSANSNLKITYYHEDNQAELKQLSRTAAKILDAHNHSHILAMQEIAPEPTLNT